MTSQAKLVYWNLMKGRFIDAIMEGLPRNRAGDFLWSVTSHWRTFGTFPRLRNPATFNEHLLHLKLSGALGSKLRVRISDKELVKDYIREKLGDGYTPNTIAVLKSEQEIRNYRYPDRCILKPTHCSGYFVITNNGPAGIEQDEIISWLGINYYEGQREINYRELEPKVIVEELLIETGSEVPRDYKIFCFHGRPAFISVVEGRLSGRKINYFSPEWRVLPISRKVYLPAQTICAKPPGLERMLHAARVLSADFSFVRIDFYQIGDKVLIGELTNLPDAAKLDWSTRAIDLCIGRLFETPDCHIESLLANL